MAAESRGCPRIAMAVLALLLAGCQSLPTTAPPPGAPYRNIYKQDKDSAPATATTIDYNSIPDAVPADEPRSKYGNKSPYTVLGRDYEVLADAQGYSETGTASWYGEKFHGFRTSSFEPYDMHAMTAAHKTLPIPSWVRVTHLENGRSVVVRVNDRGPFKEGRIIDLSWAAAKKLGYADKGTAPVRIEAVFPATPATLAGSAASTQTAVGAAGTKPAIETVAGHFYVQLGAFAAAGPARELEERARTRMTAAGDQVRVLSVDGLHRVRVGPYEDRTSAESARDALLAAGTGTPVLVFVPATAASPATTEKARSPAP